MTATCLLTLATTFAQLADPWEREYAEADAKADHVIALWQFNAGAELADSSTNGHDLTLAGAETVPDGRFGGALRSFPGWPVEDEKHAAIARNHPSLSPQGAFTIDLWLKPADDMPEGSQAFLLCKKYVSDNDYQLILTPDRNGRRRVQLNLGFGEDSEAFHSDPVEWPADQWQHLAVTYDGQGTVAFHRNGEAIGGKTAPGRYAISPGRLALTIGDRTGSYHYGFSGVLDEIRISRGVREFGRVRVELDLDRRVYVRKENAPEAVVQVTNLRQDPIARAKVVVSMSGERRQEFVIENLGQGEPATLSYAIDAGLRPDEYELRVETIIDDSATQPEEESRPYQLTQSFPLRIVPRPLPNRMPVVMWGVGGISNILTELPRLKELGFTHCLGLNVDMGEIWRSGQPLSELDDGRKEEVISTLDALLAEDFRTLISISPGRTLHQMTEEFARVDRDGEPLPRAGVNGLHEPVRQFCENVGVSVGRLYGGFPAFDGALIHTEVRDHANLSFSDVDENAYMAATGNQIPPEPRNKRGVNRSELENFPADGVIPDDHPLYVYYQWYWREGDGWPGLNTAVADGIRQGADDRDDLWTFHDPAVRVASVFGSGGNVDALSQWTYSYPEPLRIGLPTDELFAMARGADPAPDVMKMTQIIWYRSQTAPIARSAEDRIPSPWDDHDPDAAYITIAPMHLREAFWTKISRPIQGIMYQGWQSLVPTDSTSSYRYTHPETRHELRRLTQEVVKPFGPMLRRVPAAKSDVAFYESFAAQMFAGRGAYGWSRSWTGDCYQVLQRAGLQADVVYDESILRFGLDDYKVLVIPDGDVLIQSVADRIREFQARGGVVVADDRLASAIRPDVRLTPMRRTRRADADKETLLELSQTLRESLDGKYEWPAESSNLEVVPYRREYSEGDAANERSTYLFVVNDNREFGAYVGQHGLVQEVGRFSETELTLRNQAPGSVVYEMPAGRRVTGVRETATGQTAELKWPATLGPCDGRIYLSVPRPIAEIAADLPESVAPGESFDCVIEVRDDGGPVPATLPVHVELRDPDGRPAEFSGYYAAVGGRLEIRFDLAENDLEGPWHLVVRDLASGQSLDREMRVAP